MDKNTVVGLVLIGTILAAFTIFNRPSEEELRQQKKEQVELAKQENKAAQKEANESSKEEEKAVVAKKTESTSVDSMKVEEKAAEIIRLENEKLIIDFTTKGGQIAAVYLKEFESYYNFSKNDDKIQPLKLFGENDNSNSLILTVDGKTINTADYVFTAKKSGKRGISFEYEVSPGKKVAFDYNLQKDAYDIAYDLELVGMKQAIQNKVAFQWNTAFKKSERLFSEQRRVSTICFKNSKDGFDYLSETGDDDQEAEDDITWIAYKQSYFSSIIQPANAFKKSGSVLEVRNYKDNEKRINTHLKDFESKMILDLPASDNATLSFNWFFGPNDYEVLKAHGEGYDDILNFGWGLFRWINLYAVQPMFNLLIESGISIGIAILLLTLVLKIVLTPIQWKMYVSSAKMRILKPEVDELNAKYPNKADAMKKQMEMMALYKESGASPLAGCVPMLIQMPILLAVFRFFPSAFELRQKGFLWAEDLSSYDSILDLGTYIWPYGDHVSLFTLLMAGTTLIYTHINSGNMQQPNQPGMPNMKVIMYIFPFMMIFFFNNYSSGLSYYYFISTLISIIMMVLIKNFFVDEEKLKAKMAARKANMTGKPKKGKSKFQERLETMQKMQQEKLKKK